MLIEEASKAFENNFFLLVSGIEKLKYKGHYLTGQGKKTQVKNIIFGNYILKKLLREEAECIKSFAAVQCVLERPVEIRILDIGNVEKSPVTRRFVEELKVLSSIDHPSILKILDQGVIKKKYYFTTPYHRNVRLKDYLESRGGSLPEDEFLKFAEILTDAVSVLHSEDKLHRGITSKSVYVNLDKENGTPYIGECSSMRDIRVRSLTSMGFPILGEYVPTPEDIYGKPIDKRTDVYFLCNLFYEMLSGNLALPDSRDLLVTELKKNQNEFVSIPLLKIANKSSNSISGIDELVMKGLDSDPDKRYVDAIELAAALRSVAKKHKVQLFLRESVAKKAASKSAAKKEGKTRISKNCPYVNISTDSEQKSDVTSLYSTDSINSTKLLDKVFENATLIGSSFVLLLLLLYVGFMSVFTSSASIVEENVRESSKTRHVSLRPAFEDKARLMEAFLALAEEVKKKPTSEKTFEGRMSIFRKWLVGSGGEVSTVCSYSDLARMKYRFFVLNDKKVIVQFDEWIFQAQDLL